MVQNPCESIKFPHTNTCTNPCGIHVESMDSRRTPGGSMRIRGEYKRNPWTPQGIHRIHGHAPKGSSWNPWNPCGFHEDSAEWVESTRNRWGSVNCCLVGVDFHKDNVFTFLVFGY